MGSPKERIAAELKSREDWYRFHLPAEGPQHRVRITRPYWLGATDVTQEEYQRVMGNNPSDIQGDPKRPVEQVSWHDAVEFCRRLSQLPAEKAAKRLYSLPTEAQWEYACRAGTTTRWYSGDDEAGFVDVAWFAKNAGGKTHPVGEKKPNAWGLYDMCGNVRQWCQDWYADGYYATLPTDDPTGPGGGTGRVYRGGCWYYQAERCRSAYRDWFGPDFRINSLGLRVSLPLAPKEGHGAENAARRDSTENSAPQSGTGRYAAKGRPLPPKSAPAGNRLWRVDAALPATGPVARMGRIDRPCPVFQSHPRNAGQEVDTVARVAGPIGRLGNAERSPPLFQPEH